VRGVFARAEVLDLFLSVLCMSSDISASSSELSTTAAVGLSFAITGVMGPCCSAQVFSSYFETTIHGKVMINLFWSNRVEDY